jgi:hypothetical protein
MYPYSISLCVYNVTSLDVGGYNLRKYSSNQENAGHKEDCWAFSKHGW